ncbi:RagB/SusD family nutrient uptake outer membrane protein [Aquimarina gracilis]|uniref:RagB/SusD family nutrient uptake outer membrane protein n=1 Tax=Aquimarina gracilis TaxID=874422 RepID=A0ABU5ZRR4_9FLAO|nr:RagB/SusD family nutrient uptake outer membrane protein [Aquimarina gracilis]MEB3344771.1 RagB/SusD family nutrient uptake outer membrane protein [Aquimarina gracilis]
MKNINKIFTHVLVLIFLTSCSDDFLEVPVVDTITEDNFYATDDQLLAGANTLYGQAFFTTNDKFMYSLDMLSGNSIGFEADAPFKLFAVGVNNRTLLEGWEGFYKGIADANQLLKIIDQGLGSEISEDVKNQVEGEARFVRAFAYFYLVRLWGEVPVIDQITADTSTKYSLNTVSSIYAFIESDLKKAAELLPLSPSDERRVGKTAPWAFLAEMYLTLKDYENARDYSKMVIDSGLHSLQSNYQDQFINPSLSINREGIYRWIWTAINGLWGIQNTNQAYLIDDDDLVGNNGAFGSVAPSVDLFLAFDKIADSGEEDLRRKWIIMEPGRQYDELKTVEGGYTFPENGDNSATKIRYRKYVVGSLNEHPNVFFMRTEMSTQLMRYSDVLLMYAEAILGNAGSTTDMQALQAFNQVRTRAGLSEKMTLSQEDIFNERRIELAFEAGKFWMDLLRMDRSMAREIIRNQNRGTVNTLVPLDTEPVFVNDVDDANFLLPIPAAELSFIDTTNPAVDYIIND